MSVVFLESSQNEFAGAVRFYRRQQQELGDRFLRNMMEAVDRLSRDPTSWEVVESGEVSPVIRRCRVKGFPYVLLFTVDELSEGPSGPITIAAVMHLHRRPGYWQTRFE